MRVLGFGRLLPDVWQQWQPDLTTHDPNPPIPLESAPVVTPTFGHIPPPHQRRWEFLRLKGGEAVVVVPLPVGEGLGVLPRGGGRLPPSVVARGTVIDSLPADPTFPGAWAPPRGMERPQPPQEYFWVEPAAAVDAPTTPRPLPLPRRAATPPPDIFAWVEPLPVPPFFGQSTTLQRRPPAPPPSVETGPSQSLLGELPLPPTATPVIPRRAPSPPPDQQPWPGLSLLDPHIEDFPILPWTAATTRPQTGAWRPVGVAEGQIPPAAPAELPPGQAALGRGLVAVPRQNASWDLFWTPPDVVQALPPGAAEGGVPGRANLGTRAGVYAAVAQALLGELPPGRAAAARVPTRISPPVGSSGSTLLLFAVVVPPPAGAASAPVPGVPKRRGRTVIWSWGGYIPPPATPLPPGVQHGPFAGRGHGHAPVSPYGAAYVLSIPPALFGVAELWQFPGGLSMYTFGGDDAAAWEFQAPSTIWEW